MTLSPTQMSMLARLDPAAADVIRTKENTMSREIRRVPANFGWPIGEVWGGYRTPEYLREDKCPDCENGYSREGERLHDEWYGNAPFDPASTGSIPFTYHHEAVQAFARRNVERSPQFYGTDPGVIDREAQRLAGFWDASWIHHLSQDDVNALIADGRLRDFTHHFVKGEGWVENDPPTRPTAADVNVWSLHGFGHDSINAHICIRARAEREGITLECSTCGGHAYIEKWVGQRDFAETVEWMEPPTGEWWQMWETVSEGSPKTPAFETAEELAEHLHRHPGLMGPSSSSLSFDNALKWVRGPGWIPSGVIDSSGVHSGAALAARPQDEGEKTNV